MVLGKATDGADIYVTSDTLSLEGGQLQDNNEVQSVRCCLVKSSLSFAINSPDDTTVNITCSG